MMSLSSIILHDLPGIAEIEQLKHGKGAWLTDDEIAERADKVSLALFGLSVDDTYGPHAAIGSTVERWKVRDQRPADWENAFDVLDPDLPDYHRSEFWFDLDIDITDEQGRILRCAHLFERQMICVFKGLIPGARFTPDGGGDADALAERWGSKLEEEARLFKRK